MRSPAYSRFTERLRQARKESGLTQREVGERTGFPQSRIWDMEHGERRVDVIELAKFAKVYKKSLKWFLD